MASALSSVFSSLVSVFFFLKVRATTETSPLPLHDALPIPQGVVEGARLSDSAGTALTEIDSVSRHLAELIERSEEHTSELQSPCNLVCRLLLEKKNYHNH